MCLSGWGVCMSAVAWQSPEENARSSRAGVTSCCELPNVGMGHRTQVICQSNLLGICSFREKKQKTKPALEKMSTWKHTVLPSIFLQLFMQNSVPVPLKPHAV